MSTVDLCWNVGVRLGDDAYAHPFHVVQPRQLWAPAAVRPSVCSHPERRSLSVRRGLKLLFMVYVPELGLRISGLACGHMQRCLHAWVHILAGTACRGQLTSRTQWGQAFTSVFLEVFGQSLRRNRGLASWLAQVILSDSRISKSAALLEAVHC